MALTCATGSISPDAAIDQNTEYTHMLGNSFSGNVPGLYTVFEQSQWGISAVDENTQNDGTSIDESASWSSIIGPLTADKTYKFRARAVGNTTAVGSTKTKRVGAVPASSLTPDVTAGPTDTTVTIRGRYTPNTLESTATVWLEYKRTVDSIWTQAGAQDTGKTGYSQLSISRSLTGLVASTQYQFRLQLTRNTTTGTTHTSVTSTFTTLAGNPVLTTSDATGITSSSATLNGTVDPNNKSTACYLCWDTSSKNPPTTTYANEVFIATFSDDTVHNLATTISGLAPSTVYYFRAKGVYAGTNYWASNEKSFTTSAPPATPTITTGSASSIGETTATLNGVVNPNTHSTTYYFEYGLTTAYGSTTATQGPNSGYVDVPFSANISGLTGNTLYHFRAVAVFGQNYTGSDATFTTSSTPEGAAAEEEHTGQYRYDRIYGTALAYASQTHLIFALYTPVSSGSDTFYTGTPPTANESYIFKDSVYSETGPAATAILRSGVNSGLYYIILTASQMSAQVTDVIIHSSSNAYRDVHLQVRTIKRLGQIDVDASQMAAGTTALVVTGGPALGKSISCGQDIYTAGKVETVGNLKVGGDLAVTGNLTCVNISPTGNLAVVGNITATTMALSGVLTAGSIAAPIRPGRGIWSGTVPQSGSGTTVYLDSGASGLDSFYVGTVIGITAGTGVGQFRHIVAYSGSTKLATVNTTWLSPPGAGSVFVIYPIENVWDMNQVELTGITHDGGTPLASYGERVQALYQWFLYHHVHVRPSPTVNQNVAHKLYKSNDALLSYFDITDAGGGGGTHAPVTGAYSAGDFANAIWRLVS